MVDEYSSSQTENGSTKLVLDKITEKAKQMKGFANLPKTAQVSILYAEIDAAKKLSIPLTAICEAMNNAGSTVNVRYLRQALYVVKKRLQGTTEAGATAIPHSTSVQPSQKPPAAQTTNPATSSLAPKAAREEKANSYMTSGNPLLADFKKSQE